MIFAVVGTQKFPMNRFLQDLDALIETGAVTEEIYAQSGTATYQPKHFQYSDYISKETFEQKLEECDLLITHGGVSTIISALKKSKPIIIYPRLAKYGEHVDDHQLQIASSFETKGLVLVYKEGDDLSKLVEKSRTYTFGKYISHRQKNIDVIKKYLENIE